MLIFKKKQIEIDIGAGLLRLSLKHLGKQPMLVEKPEEIAKLFLVSGEEKIVKVA